MLQVLMHQTKPITVMGMNDWKKRTICPTTGEKQRQKGVISVMKVLIISIFHIEYIKIFHIE